MRFTGIEGRGRRLRMALGALLAAGGAAIATGAGALPGQGAAGAPGGSGWGWYKTDTHVHSSISGDAVPDLGIIADQAQADGYNVMFLTDHNLASTFPVSNEKADDVFLDDTMPRWFPLTIGAPTALSSQFVSAPVNTGTQSLHLAATAGSGVGESSVWTKRGGNFRSGDDILTFAVQPKTLTGSSGLYVSAAVGGDPTVALPSGYTTTAGVDLFGTSFVYIYYFGSPPPTADYPGSQVFTFNLAAAPSIPGLFSCDRAGVTAGVWTHCTIDLSKALPLIPAAQTPLDYDAFSDLKIGSLADKGTADAYFDSYELKASAPVAAADEFVFRNSFVSQYDTPTFKLYPGVEMGVGDHTNRFNFGFSDPAQFASYANGIDGIADTHASGYLAQLDHPGVAGGVTDQEAVGNNAYGADVMEVRFQNMIDDWDQLLTKGVDLPGTWSTDNHNGTWSAGSQATWIQAPSISLNDLMRSMYEGRMYLAQSAFTGRVIFGPDASSPDPHAARYPVFVPDTQTTANAHLSISGGINPGDTVAWITNGPKMLATDPTTGSSYDAVKQVPLTATPFTYVRVELRDASGIQRAMTEPILFAKVAGLPPGTSVGVDTVATPNGIGYTNQLVKGATAAAYNASAHALTLTLDNPAGSLVDFEAATGGSVPASVSAGGAPVPRASSLADEQAATGASWFYDTAAGVLHARVPQGAGPTDAVVTYASGSDAVAPSPPPGLVAMPTGPTQVHLSWSPASDAVGIAGYDVYRGGASIARLGPGATSYDDTGLAAGASYQYGVDAFDAAGNVSPVATVNATTGQAAAPGSPQGPPAATTPGDNRPGPTPPALSPSATVQEAFRQIDSQPHGEAFRTSVSLLPAKLAAARPTPVLRPVAPVRFTALGQAIVQDASHARATVHLSGVRTGLNVVVDGGKVFAARAGGRYRLATGRLRAMLPPAVPSGLGQRAVALAHGLVKLRDLGVAGGVHRYRASLAPAVVRNYLAASLVRAGLPATRARAIAAAARIGVDRVDLEVQSGQLGHERVTVSATLPAGSPRGAAASTLSAQSDVRLSDYGAELSILAPHASGVAATVGRL